MSKTAKRIFWTLLIWILILGAAAFGVVGYWLPYQRAENTMPASGTMILTQLEDGTTELSWPRGVNAQYHLLEILRSAADSRQDSEASQPQKEVLYSAYIASGTTCVLPELPTDEELTIRVNSIRNYFFPFDDTPRLRFGQQSMEITGVFQPPAISSLTWAADAEAKTVAVRFDLPADSTAQMYYVEPDGTSTLLRCLKEGRTSLDFGEDQDFPIPGLAGSHTFTFDVYSECNGYVYYGTRSGEFTVVREDLLGTKLYLNCVDEGNNVFSFSWNETKGDHYELQQYDEETGTWITVYKAAQDEPRSYTTGHLDRYSTYQFRVVAVGGQTLPDSEFAATPDEVQVSTGASVVYSTIWPIQNLEIYSTPEKNEMIGTAPGAQAYCVLDMVDGMFRIRHEDGFGYIDSDYCMINLPEFIGDICLYNIVNSYDALYMAHEYEIPTVTGEVIVGYEQVMTAEEEFLVPLLYPSALKLEQAAFTAMDQGYKLKIYDSFRPKEATLALYDQAIQLAGEPIPEETYSGEPVEDLPELEEGEILTYEMLMTDNGRYTMNYFLAATGSRHNQGIAMDLTIVGLWDGVELEMQTSMHDLSWYSELARNNDNADTLSDIMTGAGFADLVSEWWHFQDDEAKDELSPQYLRSGVTAQCWVADDVGWRYRTAGGMYLTGCSEYIGDVLYTFDADGYVQID